MNNGYGNVRVTRETDLAAYDRAPPRLRWLIRNAVSPFSAVHMLRRYQTTRAKRGHAEALQDCAARIRATDHAETIAAYGPTHPEAGPIMAERAA